MKLKSKLPSWKRLLLGAVLIVIWGVIIFLIINSEGDFSLEKLLHYCPDNVGLALLALAGIFLLKSVDFILPTGIIFAAVGIMFPLPAALLINIGGICIILIVPYFAAKFLTGVSSEGLIAKSEKLRKFHSFFKGSDLLKAVLLRALYVPVNIGTLYMSLMGFSCITFVAGSLIGWLPSMICYTVIGTKIDDWRSPEFIICVSLNVLLVLISLTAYHIIQKKAEKEKMEHKRKIRGKNLIYRFIRWLVTVFYPKMTLVGAENLPEGPSIIVGNHSQMNGPICSEIYTPGLHYTWCIAQMMHCKEVPAYAYHDFYWDRKPRWIRWFYHLLSYLIAPLADVVFSNAFTVGVYTDTRILDTFKETVERLQEGARIIIFPEQDQPHNQIVCDFQVNFTDVAKQYHRRTGECLAFVPMYIAPRLHKVIYGKPITYDPGIPIKKQRSLICNYLMDEITQLAEAQPPHTVVPYPNIPKKDYPQSRPAEETKKEVL